MSRKRRGERRQRQFQGAKGQDSILLVRDKGPPPRQAGSPRSEAEQMESKQIESKRKMKVARILAWAQVFKVVTAFVIELVKLFRE